MITSFIFITCIFLLPFTDSKSNESSCYNNYGKISHGPLSLCLHENITGSNRLDWFYYGQPFKKSIKQENHPNGIFLVGGNIQLSLNPSGSFGSSFQSPPNVYALDYYKQLGIISRLNQTSGVAGRKFTGDYILPGIPYEGYYLQFESLSGTKTILQSVELLMKNDFPSTTFEITSTESTQSAHLVNRNSLFEVASVTSIHLNSTFFTTSVTVTYIGESPIKNLYYVRGFDPDPEWQLSKDLQDLQTRNYVRYQPRATDGSDDGLERSYKHPLYPNAAMVVCSGRKYSEVYGAFGTVHSRARALHSPIYLLDPQYLLGYGDGDRDWTYYGGADLEVNGGRGNTSRMQLEDYAIYLTYYFPTVMMPGESIQMTYFHLFREADMSTAFAHVAAIVILQPTRIISGSAGVVCVQVNNLTLANNIARWEVLLFAKYRTSSVPSWHVIGTINGSVFSEDGKTAHTTLRFDTEVFQDAAAQLKVVAYDHQGMLSQVDKSISVVNNGTLLCFEQTSTEDMPLLFHSNKLTSLNMTASCGLHNSAGKSSTSVVSANVDYFIEAYMNQTLTSTYIGSASSFPWSINVDVSALANRSIVYIRALVNKHTISVYSGTVFRTNQPPSLRFISRGVDERSPPGTVIGRFVYYNPNFVNQEVEPAGYVLDLLDLSSRHAVALSGTNLVVNGTILYSDYVEMDHVLRFRVLLVSNECLDLILQSSAYCHLTEEFEVQVNRVPYPATGLHRNAFSIPENATIGTVVGTLVATTSDPTGYGNFTYELQGDASPFTLNNISGVLSVTVDLNYEAVSEYTLLVKIAPVTSPTDAFNNASNPYYSIVRVNVTDCVDTITGVDMTCTEKSSSRGGCVVNETAPVGWVVGRVMVTSEDGDSSLFRCSSHDHFLNISSSGVVTVARRFPFMLYTYSHKFAVSISSTDGQTRTVSFAVVVMNSHAPFVQNSTCTCDEDRERGQPVFSHIIGQSICTVSAVSHDSRPLTYSILSSRSHSEALSPREGVFTVDSCSGVLRVNGSLSFTASASYVVSILVESSLGWAVANITIDVVPVPKPPVFQDVVLSADDLSAAGTVVARNLSYLVTTKSIHGGYERGVCAGCVFAILHPDPSVFFNIRNSSTGELVLAKGGIQSTTTPWHRLTVRVTDGLGMFVDGRLTIVVLAAPRTPRLAQSNGILAEITSDATASFALGEPIFPIVSDPGLPLSWALRVVGPLSRNLSACFALRPAGSPLTDLNISGAHIWLVEDLRLSTLPNGFIDIVLQITVTSPAYPHHSSSANHTIRVTQSQSSAPVVPNTISFSVREDTPRLAAVGDPLREYVQNSQTELLSFYISDFSTDHDRTFFVNSSTGQFHLDVESLRFKIRSTFNYIVRISNSNNQYSTALVHIYVTPVLKPPTFLSVNIAGSVSVPGSPYSSRFVSHKGQPVTYSAYDNHQSKLTFRVVAVNSYVELSHLFSAFPLSSGSSAFYLEPNSSYSFDHKIESSYTVNVSASNSNFTSYSVITVFIPDVNDQPKLVDPIQCFVWSGASVGEDVCTIFASDGDSPDEPHGWGALRFYLVDQNTGLSVTTSTIGYGHNVGVVRLRTGATTMAWFRTGGENRVSLTVTDGGNLSATITLVVTVVTRASRGPSCPAINSFQVSENATVGTVVGRIPFSSGQNASIIRGNVDHSFRFNVSTGELMVGKALNYSMRALYTMVLNVLEISESPLSATCLLEVQVEENYHAPLFLPLTILVLENQKPGTLSTHLQLTHTYSRAHGSFSMRCLVCGAGQGRSEDFFGVDGDTGMVFLRPNCSLSYERTQVFEYLAIWTDGITFVTTNLTIRVLDVPEPPVVFSSSFIVPETTSGTIGSVNVVDPDYPDSEIGRNASKTYCGDRCRLVYRIISGGFGVFEVNPITGVLSVTEGSKLDYEDRSRYTLTVSATDATGFVSSNTVNILVTDVSDCSITAVTSNVGLPVRNVSTIGGTTLLISGTDFGPTVRRMNEDHISFSHVEVEAVLRSDTMGTLRMTCDMRRSVGLGNMMLTCTLPAGGGRDWEPIVTISATYADGLHMCTTSRSSTVHRLSYASPKIHRISIVDKSYPYLSGEGGSEVRVHGQNFGLPSDTQNVSLLYSNRYTSNSTFCYVTIPDSVLTCVVGPGAGPDIQFAISRYLQISPMLATNISYSPPVLSSVMILPRGISEPAAALLDSLGGDRLLVQGRNLGNPFVPILLKYGISRSKLNFTALCTVIVSYTRLSCMTSAGFGGALVFRLSVAGLESSPFLSNISYTEGSPRLLAINTRGEASTSGGFTIDIFGRYFQGEGAVVTVSDPLFTGDRSHHMSPAQCEVMFQNDTVIRCRAPPGYGSLLRLSVIVAGVTVSTSFAYAPPVVNTLRQSRGGDASGGEVWWFYGRNFGPYQNHVNVSVSGAVCKGASWLADDPAIDNYPYLKCTTTVTTVGPKTVTMTVAGQSSVFVDKVLVGCKRGWYGREGEVCRKCAPTEGLVCDDDGLSRPISTLGYFKTKQPKVCLENASCVRSAPCFPADACTGNDTCSPGYEGWRCGVCSEGHFFIGGECALCPSQAVLASAVLVLTLLAAGTLVLVWLLWTFGKGSVCLLQAIDFLQAIAVLCSLQPQRHVSSGLSSLLFGLSPYVLHLNTISTACFSESVQMSFETRWLVVAMLPWALLLCYACICVSYIVWNPMVRVLKVTAGPLAEGREGVGGGLGSLLVFLGGLGYLPFTLHALSIFDCRETEPSDGRRYLASVGLGVDPGSTMERGACYESGSIQQHLQPWAILLLLTYSLGFPIFLAYIVRNHMQLLEKEKRIIQIWSSNISPMIRNIATDEHVTTSGQDERKRRSRRNNYAKLLKYHIPNLKPEYCFWILVNMFRKLLLGVVVVFSQPNQSFLLTILLCIWFVYLLGLQSFQPYEILPRDGFRILRKILDIVYCRKMASKYPHDSCDSGSFPLDKFSEQPVSTSNSFPSLILTLQYKRMCSGMVRIMNSFTDCNIIEKFVTVAYILILSGLLIIYHGVADRAVTDFLSAFVVVIVVSVLTYLVLCGAVEWYCLFHPIERTAPSKQVDDYTDNNSVSQAIVNSSMSPWEASPGRHRSVSNIDQSTANSVLNKESVGMIQRWEDLHTRFMGTGGGLQRSTIGADTRDWLSTRDRAMPQTADESAELDPNQISIRIPTRAHSVCIYETTETLIATNSEMELRSATNKGEQSVFSDWKTEFPKRLIHHQATGIQALKSQYYTQRMSGDWNRPGLDDQASLSGSEEKNASPELLVESVASASAELSTIASADIFCTWSRRPNEAIL